MPSPNPRNRNFWLFLLGLVLLLGSIYFLTRGPVASIDPGQIEVSNDSYYDGPVSEDEGSIPHRKNKQAPRPPAELKLIPPLPQDPLIKVYFNQEHSSSYSDPYRNVARYGTNLEQVIVNEINKAQVSLDLAVHELNLPGVAQAIVKKQQQGVKVRLIMENNYTRDAGLMTAAELGQLDERSRSRFEELRSYIDENEDGTITPQELADRDALYMFNKNKLFWIDDTADGTKGTGIMHDKYVLIDNQELITGSTNMTFSDVHGDKDAPDTRGNNNNLLVISSPQLVNIYRQDFNEMWGDGPGGLLNSHFGKKKKFMPPQAVLVGSTPVEVAFSPASNKVPNEQRTNSAIAQTLSQAKVSIHLALFVFSAQEIADALLTLKNQNPTLDIKGVFDPNFSYRDFSETLDFWGVSLANRSCTLEAGNQPWSTPLTTIGIPLLPEGDKMHHKYAVVDSTTIITGSHNWSKAANETNDENTLIIRNPVVAAHYEREFERMYQRSFLGPSKKLLAKIQETPTRCPTVTQATEPKGKKKNPESLTNQSTTPSTTATTTDRSVVVNINSADPSELDSLPGIGPTVASAIVAYRQTNGPFTSLEELDNVKGIGPKLLEKLQGKLTF